MKIFPKEIKAVILDIDGTLAPGTSWTRLTRDLGASTDQHLKIFEEFTEGRITYEDAVGQLLKLWRATGKATKQDFQAIFENWPLREESKEVVDFLKSKGYIVVKITGSMDLYAEVVAKKLGISFYYANTGLVWDNEGKLVDFHYFKDQAGKKVEQLLQFCREQGLSPEDCVVVGDGINDIELFKLTRGVALKSPNSAEIEKIAWKTIDNLSELKEALA